MRICRNNLPSLSISRLENCTIVVQVEENSPRTHEAHTRNSLLLEYFSLPNVGILLMSHGLGGFETQPCGVRPERDGQPLKFGAVKMHQCLAILCNDKVSIPHRS
jgi:hypothetical protein